MHKPSNPSQKRGQKPLDVSTVNVSFKPQGNLTCTRSIFNDLLPLHQVRFRDGWTFKCPFVLLSYLFLNRTRVALLTTQFSLNPSKGRKGLHTQFKTLSIISLPCSKRHCIIGCLVCLLRAYLYYNLGQLTTYRV